MTRSKEDPAKTSMPNDRTRAGREPAEHPQCDRPREVGPSLSYAEALAAVEDRRRRTDDILLRRMATPRDAARFGRFL